ncbi:MAG: DsrE/DsrF/DrsH-like family protein, partial [Thermoplasmata archaeon]|nr:DsrE/DsrF/DrsH-like family protein [Thermoplasmata archaeon]
GWLETLKTAKELGNVKVNICANTADLMDLKLEDFEDIVDDIVGVGEYVNNAKDAKITLFI